MNAPTLDDIAELRAIAERGRSAPLLGGAHLILWGAAMALALLINWGVAARVLPWPGYSLAISWFGIVLAAWAASVVLGRRQTCEPGAHSVGNRVERAAWMTAGGFLATLAVALFVRASLGGDEADWSLFAIMPPVMFGAYAMALQASAVAAGSKSLKAYVLVSLALAATTAYLIGDVAQYLVAAGGVAIVSILPGLGQLAAARRTA
jgi:hypothetical protein